MDCPLVSLSMTIRSAFIIEEIINNWVDELSTEGHPASVCNNYSVCKWAHKVSSQVVQIGYLWA